MKVHEAIGETLRREGVDCVFAVMGDGNMRLLAELTERTGIRIVFARHETAAVAMADAYARVSGSIGICSVTAGPGLALTALPLLTAARRRTPLLLIAGDTAVGDTGRSQDIDQRRFVQGLGLESHELTRPDFAVEDVRFALDTAASRSQPVVLNAPVDVQDAEYSWDVEERRAAVPLSSRWAPTIGPGPAELQRATEIIGSARYPVIIAGRGAMEDGAGAAIQSLSRLIQAPLFTTLPAKGLFPDGSPMQSGIAGLFASVEGRGVLAVADCVIVIGSSLNQRTTMGGTLFPAARIVRIDRRPPSPQRVVPAVQCYLQGSARFTTEALTAALAGGRQAPDSAASAPPPQAAPPRDAPEVVGGLLNPRYVMRAADAVIPPDATIVIGVGHFFSFAVEELRAAERRFIFPHDFGAIGQGLPMAIGAAAASGRRTVVVEGDASIIMCAQELDTAARYGLPVTVLVLNDEALGAEFHKLRSKGLDPWPSLMPSPDLAAVAVAFGAQAATARTGAEVRRALEESQRATEPYLIDFRVTREVVSEPYRTLHFPGAGQS